MLCLTSRRRLTNPNSYHLFLLVVLTTLFGFLRLHPEDPHAYMSLAKCYSEGKGVEISHEKAFEYHMKAATLGM